MTFERKKTYNEQIAATYHDGGLPPVFGFDLEDASFGPFAQTYFSDGVTRFVSVAAYTAARLALVSDDVSLYERVMAGMNREALTTVILSVYEETGETAVISRVMTDGYLALFREDSDLGGKLMSTRNRVLICSDEDVLFGIGDVGKFADSTGSLRIDPDDFEGENVLGAVLTDVRKRLWLDYIERSERFLSRVLNDDDMLKWCRSYSFVVENPAYPEMETALNVFLRDAHRSGLSSTDFARVLAEAEIDEESIWRGSPGWLRHLSYDALLACMAFQFRARHSMGTLMDSSIGKGALLPYFAEMRYRLLRETFLR
ncbi:MAG: DUF1768 domain-containing protein [Eubacteriaceae bacterium]|nr:DUF1768 domain-containing protein [Eubacteriaceae bacterium]